MSTEPRKVQWVVNVDWRVTVGTCVMVEASSREEAEAEARARMDTDDEFRREAIESAWECCRDGGEDSISDIDESLTVEAEGEVDSLEERDRLSRHLLDCATSCDAQDDECNAPDPRSCEILWHRDRANGRGEE